MPTPLSDAATNPQAQGADVLIIGLGNAILRDEGIGIHVLRQLERGYAFNPPIALLDGGTMGLELLALFETHRLILLIDAIFAPDAAPGEIHILRDDAIQAALSKKLSMHHLGISEVLGLARLLAYRPHEIVMLGVVPEILALGTELSTPVQQRLPDILTTVETILNAWGIAMQPRTPERPAPGGRARFAADPLDSQP